MVGGWRGRKGWDEDIKVKGWMEGKGGSGEGVFGERGR